MDELRDKIHAGLKGDNSDEDTESDVEGDDDDDDDDNEEDELEANVYKLGATSGSKLVDR